VAASVIKDGTRFGWAVPAQPTTAACQQQGAGPRGLLAALASALASWQETATVSTGGRKVLSVASFRQPPPAGAFRSPASIFWAASSCVPVVDPFCNHSATQMLGPRSASLGRLGKSAADFRCKSRQFLWLVVTARRSLGLD